MSEGHSTSRKRIIARRSQASGERVKGDGESTQGTSPSTKPQHDFESDSEDEWNQNPSAVNDNVSELLVRIRRENSKEAEKRQNELNDKAIKKQQIHQEAMKEVERLRKQIRDEAIRETERKYKRKVQETFQCVICLHVPKEGQLTQCQNGHLLCEDCTDNNKIRTCPNCREALDKLTGNKKIRNLAAMQLIEFMDLEYECRHPGCEFTAGKDDTILHEKRCEHRLVPCPDRCCKQQFAFRNVLDHMMYGKEEHHISIVNDGAHRWSLRERHQSSNINWPCKIFKYQERLFIATGSKVEGTYYLYLKVVGDLSEANQFKVAISVGKGRQTGLIHVGRVFPIDAKQEDIIEEESGVLSFSQGGMGKTLFEPLEDGSRRVTMDFKIGKSSDVSKIITVPFSISTGI